MESCKKRPCVLTLFCHLFLTIFLFNFHRLVGEEDRHDPLVASSELFHFIRTLALLGVWKNEDVLPLYRMEKESRIHGYWNKCEFNFSWPPLIF